ncbi:hypothetical protein F4779DRAFT_639927 [Xylariaceae sp. FL0662B]|nr:hypothetical protein F4779DRAFT_639927 [Xylariaceae sp. FL0662B]
MADVSQMVISPNQGSDVDTTMAVSIRSFPAEILHACFSYFCPEEPHSGNWQPNAEFSDCQTTLRNLSLASRQFTGIAQEILFRHIAITNGEQLVLLFRSLWNNTSLRKLPRSLVCTGVLTEEDFVASVSHHWNLSIPNIATGVPMNVIRAIVLAVNQDLQIPTDALWSVTGVQAPVIKDFPQILLGLLLAYSERLSSVNLQIPQEDVLSGLPEGATPNLEPYKLLTVAVATITSALPEQVLCEMKTLRIRGINSGIAQWVQGDRILFPFWTLGVVQHFESYGGSVIWSHLLGDQIDRRWGSTLEPWLKERRLAWFAAIEDLRLYFCRTHSTIVYDLVEKCPNLTTFHWVFNEDLWIRFSITEAEKRTINEVLMKASGKLERLYIETLKTDPRGRRALIMEKISCLPSFTRLTHLWIDTLQLWGPFYGFLPTFKQIGQNHIYTSEVIDFMRSGTAATKVPLSSLLPRSLVQLVVIERSLNKDLYHPSFSSTPSHGFYITNLLHKFADDCPLGQPNLRKFRFRLHPSFKRNDMKHEDVFERESHGSQGRVTTLPQRFQDVGVEFGWVYTDARPPLVIGTGDD